MTSTRIAELPLSPQQRLVRSVPALRSSFWVPRGCVPEPSALGPGDSQCGDSAVLFKPVHPEPAGDNRLYVAELVPGKVVGDALLIATSDDLVLGGIQGLHGVSDPASHWMLRRCRYRREVRLPGTAIMLAAAAGHNYYHWLFDSLPRLRLLEQAGCDWRQADHLLLNQTQHPFHAQILDRLGVPAHNRLCCSKSAVLRCDRLLVPSPPAEPMGFPAWIFAFLRETFLPLAQGTAGKSRIYISRREARFRKLVNELEIESVLARANFKAVCLEDYSFVQQVGLFAAAEAVVAVHGAGLANLAFANPGTRVIEFVSPTFINHCYEKLARAQNLNYVEVIGQMPRAPRKRADEDDILIPLPMLKQALDQCGV